MAGARNQDTDPTPATSDPAAATGDTQVRLAHFWTDPAGTQHRPGDTVTVTADVAQGLRNAGYVQREPVK